MRLADQYTDKKALVITLCWFALLVLTGSTVALLFLAPALLIAIPLFGGRYIGEELIVKLATRRPRASRSGVAWLPPTSPEGWHPRGASLVAFSLAKRPPPLRLRLLPQN